jgi:hypothetical protein
MTEPSGPDQSLAAAIRAVRHDILSNGRRMAWDDVRERIRVLIRDGRPSPEERIQLLELYDIAVTMAQRRLRPDAEASRRLGYQRANDTLLFLMAEVRDEGEVDAATAMVTIMARELAAGRMELGGYFSNLVTLVLERFEDPRDGYRTPPEVAEDAAAFSFPTRFSHPLANPPFQPWR